MAIKKYGPTTPGRRGMTVTDYSVQMCIRDRVYTTVYVTPREKLLDELKANAKK